MVDDAPPRKGGLLASLRDLIGTGIELLQVRIELLATEVQEEKARLIAVLAYGAAAVLLLGFGILFLAVFMTVLLWDSHRLLALGIFTAVFLLSGGAALFVARSNAQAGSRLFSASLEEFSRDKESLRSRE